MLPPKAEDTRREHHFYDNKDASFAIVTPFGMWDAVASLLCFLSFSGMAGVSTTVTDRFMMDGLAESTCFTEVNKSFVAVIYYPDRERLHVSLSLIAVVTLVLKTSSSAFLQALVCFSPPYSFSRPGCTFSMNYKGQTECLGMYTQFI